MYGHVLVVVIGENNMQNELLVNFLSEKAGFSCETTQSLPPLIQRDSYKHRIALIDTKGLDKQLMWGMCEKDQRKQ